MAYLFYTLHSNVSKTNHNSHNTQQRERVTFSMQMFRKRYNIHNRNYNTNKGITQVAYRNTQHTTYKVVVLDCTVQHRYLTAPVSCSSSILQHRYLTVPISYSTDISQYRHLTVVVPVGIP